MLESKGMLDVYPARENPQAEARLSMALSLLNRNRNRQRISSPKSYDSIRGVGSVSIGDLVSPDLLK